MPKICEIVSDTKHLSETTIQEVLKSQSCIIKYAYVLHDKDTLPDGTLKEPHYHVALQFNHYREFDYIAKWFKLPVQFVSKIKGRFNDVLKYLTHANAPDKFQYPNEAVVSNFDISAYIEQNDTLFSFDAISQKIMDGEVREYNISDYVDVKSYVKYKESFDKVFVLRRKSLELKTKTRNINVCFIEGSAGSGKTFFAKRFCESKHLSYCISSSQNDPLQDYGGQDVLILDDLRDSYFSLTDLLRIIDPNTRSSVKSRYHNRFLECDYIFITSTVPLDLWYKNMNNERREQLDRRISNYFIIDSDNVHEYRHFPDGSNEELTIFTNPLCILPHINNPKKSHSILGNIYDIYSDGNNTPIDFNFNSVDDSKFHELDLMFLDSDNIPPDFDYSSVINNLDEPCPIDGISNTNIETPTTTNKLPF